MLPIAVDLTRVRVVLVGEGSAARRRLALLDEAGSRELEVYAPDPTPGLLTASGDRLRARWPEPEEIRRGQLVFLAGVPDAAARRIRRIAMCAGVLLNVEDDRAGSNFHSCSVLRRGDLTVAVSTNGRSPGLAAALRRQLEAAIGPEWRDRLELLANLRAKWRAAGIGTAAIAQWTTASLQDDASAFPNVPSNSVNSTQGGSLEAGFGSKGNLIRELA